MVTGPLGRNHSRGSSLPKGEPAQPTLKEILLAEIGSLTTLNSSLEERWFNQKLVVYPGANVHP